MHADAAPPALPWTDRLRLKAQAPVDGASLAALRILLGAVMAFGAARFLAYGWVERFFVKPTFFFKYWGFEWVEVLPPWGMYAAFWVMLASALCVMAGLFYRPALLVFLALFTWVELIDVTNYLNHYYLVSLLGLLMWALPLGRVLALDNLLWPQRRLDRVPAWMVWIVRAQVGAVYFFAGVAKCNPDWLLHAQPLQLWMTSRAEGPLVGPWLGSFPVALAMSWAGCLHDLLVPFALLHRRLRPVAYAALVVFHALTGYLFTLGLFPLIMTAAATVFFSPGWPRRLLRRLPLPAEPAAWAPRSPRIGRLLVGLAALWVAFQLLFPLRAFLYPGDVLWHEQGMRWSWRVMLREKNGSVTFHVRDPQTGRTTLVVPCNYLTDYQEREMSGQPDLILQLAHHVGQQEARRLGRPVEVRVDARASLNGRRAAPLIDPTVDLMTVRDGLLPARWITAAPEGPPRRLTPPGP